MEARDSLDWGHVYEWYLHHILYLASLHPRQEKIDPQAFPEEPWSQKGRVIESLEVILKLLLVEADIVL